MTNPSPRSHLYRLAIILVAGGLGFLALRAAGTPASWDYQQWFRMAALEEMKARPLVYGGIDDLDPSKRNESCVGCHAEEHDEAATLSHRTVSCEVCHGALGDHVGGESKIADATVDSETNWQCLNCHRALISRPESFPQYRPVATHAELEGDEWCGICHAPHDPTP